MLALNFSVITLPEALTTLHLLITPSSRAVPKIAIILAQKYSCYSQYLFVIKEKKGEKKISKEFLFVPIYLQVEGW